MLQRLRSKMVKEINDALKNCQTLEQQVEAVAQIMKKFPAPQHVIEKRLWMQKANIKEKPEILEFVKPHRSGFIMVAFKN
jgi:hypothetical protein